MSAELTAKGRAAKHPPPLLEALENGRRPSVAAGVKRRRAAPPDGRSNGAVNALQTED